MRNYLMKMGMLATLDCFQVEWFVSALSCGYSSPYILDDLLVNAVQQVSPKREWPTAGLEQSFLTRRLPSVSASNKSRCVKLLKGYLFICAF